MAHRVPLLVAVVTAVLMAPGVSGQTKEGGQERPLVLEIVDPHHPLNEGKVEAGRPPILFEGMQAQSFDQLRAWLLLRANPRRYPDETMPEIRPGLRPSNKTLVVKCGEAQIFGWVQAILQYCTFVPGREQSQELRESPLIYRVELELGETGRRLVTPLPVDRRVSGREDPHLVAEIVLKVPKSEWSKPAHEREVIFIAGGSNAPFGRSNGIAYHSTKPGHYSLLLDPPSTLLRIRQYLSGVRQADPEATATLGVSARTPMACVFEIIEAIHDEGLKSVSYSGIPASLMKDIEAAAMESPWGLAELLAKVRTQGGLAGQVDPNDAIGIGGGAQARANRRNLRALGGGGKTQRAVDLGLDWLARHQSPNGAWDADGFGSNCDPQQEPCAGKGIAAYDVGLTGISMLAFLGAGHNHREGRYKNTVRKGLKWLKDQQDAEGCFGPRSDPHFSYCHAIATLAMAEAYGMTRSGIWKGSAQNGINYVMKMQNPYKGWRYGEKPGDNDASVTTWMVMALKSAKMAGLDVNDTSFQWAHDFIREMTDEETGRTGYTRKGERPVRAEGRLEEFPAEESESLTAAGILVRIFCNEDPRESRIVKAGAELIAKRLPRWEPDRGRVDMYYWYFGTLAMFQIGGDEWKAWNQAMKPAIMESQLVEGCAKGSWDPVGPWGKDGGRIYSTALMTLCMEVYYRYGRVFGTGR